MLLAETEEYLRRESAFQDALASGAPDEEVLRALSHYLFFMESEERSEAFPEIAEGLPGRIFWKALHEEWSSFDRIDHQWFEHLFKAHRDEWRPEYMSEDDARAYAALPDRIEIFRGQCLTRPVGLSWTTDRKIAESFANGHRGVRYPQPVIFSAIVRKKDVASVQNDRSESEIVLFRARAATRRHVEPLAE